MMLLYTKSHLSTDSTAGIKQISSRVELNCESEAIFAETFVLTISK